MANEIDFLLNEDPLKLSEQDLDKIIAYQRKAQGMYESGEKMEKKQGPKVDLVALGLVKKDDFKRRF